MAGRSWPAILFILSMVGCSPAPSPASVASLAVSPAPPTSLAGERAALPDPSSAESVSVEQLLAWADAHAPRVALARAETRRAEASREAAAIVLQANPTLQLALGGRTIGAETYLQSELGISQTVELGGEAALRREAAERTVDAALAQVDRDRWAIHVLVHGLALEAMLARQRAETVGGLVELAESLVDVTERRIEAGEEAPMISLVAQTQLAEARGLLLEAEGTERAARIALANVVGWPTASVPPIVDVLPPVLDLPPLDQLVRHAIERDPTVRALELEVDAADARVTLQDREAWPEPTVGFTWAHEGEPDASANIWLFSLGLPLPVWDRNQGARAAARAERDIAQARLLHEQVRLRAGLAEAHSRVELAAERLDLYDETIVPTAMEHLALEVRAWELGEIDITQVSQMREQVLEALLAALDARADYHASLAQLEALVGTEITELLGGTP